MIYDITSENIINWNATTAEEKKINEVACLLKTIKGEIPFLRKLGISDNYIDKPINLVKPALINDITSIIIENVEGVTVKRVEILSGETIGEFNVKVVCEIE